MQTVGVLHIGGFVLAWALDSTERLRNFPSTAEQYRHHLSTMCYNSLSLTICCWCAARISTSGGTLCDTCSFVHALCSRTVSLTRHAA